MSWDTVKSIISCSIRYNNNADSITNWRKAKLMPRQHVQSLNHLQLHKKEHFYAIAQRYGTPNFDKCSESTTRRILHTNGIKTYVAAVKPYLYTKHIAARLHWCAEREHWTPQQWDAVDFSDESWLLLRPVKNSFRVWRQAGTRNETDNIVPTLKSGNASLCTWEMYSCLVRSPLVHNSGILNQLKYIDILKQYVLPFKSTQYASDSEFIFQHDECGPHRTKRVSEFLNANNINVLACPAQSPDLKPIESVWGIKKRRLRTQPKYRKLLMNCTNNLAIFGMSSRTTTSSKFPTQRGNVVRLWKNGWWLLL